MTSSDFDLPVHPMRLGRESVLQFSPDPGWEVQVTERGDGRTYTLPSIGWAVVVRWIGYLDEEEQVGEGGANVDTDIEPVVLGDEGPQVLSAYLSDVPEQRQGAQWKVVRAV